MVACDTVFSKLPFIMETIQKLDDYLLNQTEKIYKKIHELCGIHNLILAKIFLATSYVLIVVCLLSYAIMVVKSIILTIATLIIIITFARFMLLVWFLIVFNFSNIKKETLNNSRIQLREPRIYSMIFGAAFLILDITRFFLSSSWIMFCLTIIFSAGLHFILFSIGVYFGSIEPEPPCESKLKKLVRKIRSWFETDPIPQPA